MKYYSLLFSLLFSIAGISQVWVDSNASWSYKILHQNNPGYYEYHYNQDTIIMGQTCQKITGTRNQWFWNGLDWDALPTSVLPENYTYVNGDTVFHFFNNQFFILYDFGANIGDQWMIADTNLYNPLTTCYDSAYVEVVNTGNMVINSSTYRTITLQTLDSSSYALNGLYVERFGFIPDSSRWRMAPFPQSCDPNFVIQPWHATFNCFQDDSFVLYNPTGDDCEFTPSIASIQSEENQSLSIYPNPANNKVQITTSKKCTIQVFSVSGKELKKFEIPTSYSLDISDLSAGMYYVTFTDGEEFMDVVPLVISR